MSPWLSYTGNPLQLETVLFNAKHSLIDQSLHSTLGQTTTNGDGFGIGWGGHPTDTPFRYRRLQPAWSDRNLREAARAIRAPLFVAHIRAATGTPSQETNCHPFRYGRWLFMHNGLVRNFSAVRRDLMLAIDPELFPSIEGSTDSEVLFFLALTFGLEDDPVSALERAMGLVEEVGHRHGVTYRFQGTIPTTDAERIWAFRYSSEEQSRTLYFSTSYESLKMLYPDDPRLADFDEESRIVVSDPLGDLPGGWNQAPEAGWGIVRPGQDEIGTFRPAVPATA